MRPLVATLFGSGSRRRWAVLCAALFAPVALLCGCEPDSSSLPGPSGVGGSTWGDEDGGAGGEGGSTGMGRCQDGATRTCEVDLGTHLNVTSCFRGVQTCAEGQWGPCKDAVATPPPPDDLAPLAAQTPERARGAPACSCVDAA